MENKRSYFELIIEMPYTIHNDKIESIISPKIDLVLASMSASRVYRYRKNNNYIYLFETTNRKRKGQLHKFVERNLKDDNIKLYENFQCYPLLKREFLSQINKLNQEKKIITLSKPDVFDGYNGEDVKFFNDRRGWRKWQENIYNELFTEMDQIQQADPRKIISIIDKVGNTGKSSFFKYLYFNHPEDIGRISYGTASQLRSSLINIGPKKIYIIDLTRSRSQYDKQEDLLSAVEDLKSGMVISSMYGQGRDLLMNPPHVIISSNYMFNLELMSMDRWKIYEINKKYELSDITETSKLKKEYQQKK